VLNDNTKMIWVENLLDHLLQPKVYGPAHDATLHNNVAINSYTEVFTAICNMIIECSCTKPTVISLVQEMMSNK